MTRRRLPNRRPAETISFEQNGQHFTLTAGRFADGTLAELFLGNTKGGSQFDAIARDSAVATSLALQHGCELDTLRRAVLRDARGRPSTPLGAAIDMLAEREPCK